MASGDTLVNASSSFASTGGNNTIVGAGSGSSYVNTEDSNIILGQGISGTANQSNMLIIGSGTGNGNGQINKAIICGISGVTVTGSTVTVNSSNQLGVLLSTRRVKDNIQDMVDYSSPIMQLRPVTFNYAVGQDRSIQSGLIAEEVQEVMPSLVINDSEGLPQSVKYHDLPALLLNELQKAVKLINQLQDRVAVLENK